MTTFYAGFLFLLMDLTGCAAQMQNQNAIHDLYDFDNPAVYELPKEVNQISGMSYSASEGVVYAIDDDHGDLFRITLEEKPDIQRWKFGKDRDYEDLVIWNETVYVLRSRGEIVYFPFDEQVKNKRKSSLDLKGNNEFESLYKDPAGDRLVMLCKDCQDDKNDEVSAYSFDLGEKGFRNEKIYELNTNQIVQETGNKIKQFKASAANVHPLSGDIYIISSINKMLVITDQKLNVKTVISLDEKVFKQPEGLCFTPTGDLLISNESAGKGKANIMFFQMKQ